MKKVLYMLFIGMLIMIPFGVFAEGEEEEGIGMLCYGSTLYTQEEEYSIECEVTYYGPSTDGIEISLGTNDNAAIKIEDVGEGETSLFPDKSPKASKFYSITLTDTGRALTSKKTVTITAAANGKTEEKTINIVVGKEPLDPEEKEESKIPSNNSTETKKASIVTSETANPDTADLNVVQLATLSIVFIAILLLSFKKVVKNN